MAIGRKSIVEGDGWPAEVEVLQGNSSKARTKLGWVPKVGFSELVRMMVDADIEALQQTHSLRVAAVTV